MPTSRRSPGAALQNARSPRRRRTASPWVRSLKYEPLETRLALAVFTVNNLGDGPFNNSDFVVTLRDAITAANANVAAFPGGPVGGGSVISDSIQFQAGLAGTVTLNQGELKIQSSMSIDGPGPGVVSVSGGNSGSRVFNVGDRTAANFIATISGLTIKQGQAPASTGGGILNGEDLRVGNCIITGNSAARGAGIHNSTIGVLTVVGSHIDGNTAQGTTQEDGGAALYNLGRATITGGSVNNNIGVGNRGPITNGSSSTLTIEDSTITGNNQNSLTGGVDNRGTLTVRGTTIANNKSQGGFYGGVGNNGTATLLNCTISGNSQSAIGGVGNSGTITVANCTISGNSGANVAGGLSNSGTMRLQNCTISGNQVSESGAGGVYNAYSSDSLTIENCTITLNRALSTGVGGLRHEGLDEPTIHNSIVVENFRGTGSERSDTSEIFPFSGISSNNLVGVHENFGGGSNSLVNGANGNQVGVTDPRLGPLANNGGGALTHALLAGSPAINAGSNGAIPPDVLDLDGDGVTTTEQLPFDQRGNGFARILGSAVDIGAVEVPSAGASADFNASGRIDGLDFLIWQRGFGATGAAATRSAGNADNDSDVDSADLAIWRSAFGNPAELAAVEPIEVAAVMADNRTAALTPQAIDAALAWHEQFGQIRRHAFRPRLPRAR